MSIQPNSTSRSSASKNRSIWLLLPAVALVLVGSLLPAGATEPKNKSPRFGDAYANHYKCYEATDTEELEPRDLTLEDQFGSGPAVTFRAEMLCNPVSKNNEDVPNPDTHLVCYEIVQDLEAITKKVLVENQFGKSKLIIEQSQMLCLPSSKIEL